MDKCTDGQMHRWTGSKKYGEKLWRASQRPTDRQIVTQTESEKSTVHFQMENGDKMKGKRTKHKNILLDQIKPKPLSQKCISSNPPTHLTHIFGRR